MTTTVRKSHLSRGLAALIVGGVVLLVLGGNMPATAAKAHKVTVVMKEFKYEPATIQLQVGEEVELTIRNAGQVAHEWMVGTGLVHSQSGKGFHKDLFALLKPKEAGRQYGLEKVGLPAKAEPIKRISTGVEVEPGGEVTLRFTVPASAKGTWEMGCLLTGHHESGMKGTLIIK